MMMMMLMMMIFVILIMSNSKELKHIQDGKQTDTLGNRQWAVIIVHYDHNDR